MFSERFVNFVNKIQKNRNTKNNLNSFNREAKKWTLHKQEMLEFYSQFVSKNDLCFDVGANVGNRTEVLLKLASKVVAIEPQKDCVDYLTNYFEGNNQLSIVAKALGASEGESEIFIGDVSTISSLSNEWIKSVKKSGRFSNSSWSKKQVVNITTLDILIQQFGLPSFIKIDVEGFEYQVIRGLTQPVKTLSLEFTPEAIEPTYQCIEHLRKIGDISLNYSVGESMKLSLEKWVKPDDMVEILKSFKNDNKLFGDLYVKFNN